MTGINWGLLEKAARALVDQNVYSEMRNFRSDYYGRLVFQTNIEEPCGHAGCFMGNCPFLGIKELQLVESDLISRSVKWLMYCKRVFGICYTRDAGLWQYLFGCDQSGHPEDILNRTLNAKEIWGKENNDD